jgi:hypothetical protein
VHGSSAVTPDNGAISASVANVRFLRIRVTCAKTKNFRPSAKHSRLRPCDLRRVPPAALATFAIPTIQTSSTPIHQDHRIGVALVAHRRAGRKRGRFCGR